MAGIYVHIPFCRSRCIYCGFYSTTHLELRQRYVDALCSELRQRQDYLQGQPVTTLYLGGGTPSQLSACQLEQLLHALTGLCGGPLAEVTMECNPDDVTPALAATLARLPINRVSMGVQTFSDERLRFLRRRHTAAQIPAAVELLRRAGIANISIDLMYGFPGQTLASWHDDIRQALLLGADHLSAYALAYEEGTPLYRLLEAGRVSEADEELSRQMYYDLLDRMAQAGYEHYEISNFARPGRRSRHNSSYWQQVPYLGLGAAAHSYDGRSRQWNTADVQAYIRGIESGTPLYERELLDEDTRYNELVMTTLRTREGLSLALLSDAQRRYCLQQARSFLADGRLRLTADDRLTLGREGLFVSNMIMSQLMKVE